jgi:glycosyltransferase involved in cell wall biosynthesis
MSFKIRKNSLSAVLITKNEEKNVAKCIDSLLTVADEILVIDSYSTDSTQKICENYPSVRFFLKDWEGYSATKNWGNAQAANDWILSIDADEALSPELQQSILQLKEADRDTHCFYSFNRLTNYCGQWIYHGGWYPDTKVRLFDRTKARWEGEFVHERLALPEGAKVIRLKGDCFHYSFYSVEQHVAKENKYSTLSAEDRFARGKRANVLQLVFKPLITFFTMYIIKLGFLDGVNGFIIARITAQSKFLRYAKMKQKAGKF